MLMPLLPVRKVVVKTVRFLLLTQSFNNLPEPIICIVLATFVPYLWITKSMDLGHMETKHIFQHAWGTPQVCKKLWNKK